MQAILMYIKKKLFLCVCVLKTSNTRGLGYWINSMRDSLGQQLILQHAHIGQVQKFDLSVLLGVAKPELL